MQATEPKQFYYEGLDSFRGIGILWIICCHYFPSNPFFRFGWISLEFFFLLSGFLITRVLLNSMNSKNYFRNFYTRRALRIFPIYYLFLLAVLAVIFFVAKDNHFTYYKENYGYFLTYTQNFLMVFEGSGPEKHLSHLWSLAMEEQFYLSWPLLVFLVRDLKKLRRILWGLIAFAFTLRIIIWYYAGEHFEAYHCNTFARMDTIAFGCLLGCGFSFSGIKKIWRMLLISLCVLVFLVGLIVFKNPFFTNPLFCTLGYTAFSFLGVSFLEYFIREKDKFRFLKTNKPINYIGKVSYSMYLFHLPLFLFLQPQADLPVLYTGMICIATSFILAVISYHFFEIKFLNLKKYFPR